jgi:2-polyprenyl-3-methyl-5-hydroxy-6-metoxy-1,4-benzoquinol methylase
MKRPCPACLSNNSILKYEEAISREQLNEFAFASRKRPELMHRELHECITCKTLFTPKIEDYKDLEALYRAADFDSADMANDAAQTYGKILSQLGLISKKDILDIGTGDGAFLKVARLHGANAVYGVEPSDRARDAASPDIKQQIWHGTVEDLKGHDEKYDLVTLFMTIEHVADPRAVSESAQKMLKPGGTFAIVGHDRLSLVNKILGKNSPVFDIEHLQIFSKEGIESYLVNSGFEFVSAKHFRNSYPLHYWIRLAPVPSKFKDRVESSKSSIFKWNLGVNVGNVIAVGTKPR